MCTNAFAASVKQFCSFKNDVTNLAARNESATTICREMLNKINPRKTITNSRSKIEDRNS